MTDLAIESVVPGKDQEPGNLQNNLWDQKNLADFKEIGTKNTANTASAETDSAPKSVPDAMSLFKAGQQQLPGNWDKDLGELQKQLERTQKLIKEMKDVCDPGLYDLELSRRSFTGNPYKILTAGSGLAMLPKNPMLATVPLAGFAALQGYDDFKMLGKQDSLLGRSKYTLGLLADGSAAAGALGFLSESVPMRYKLPMLLGGLAVRAAVDFIPDKKN